MRALALSLALFSLVTPAVAQVQFGFGGNDPIAVEAEKATYKGGLTILETNVVARQADTTVMADRMDIFRAQSESANSITGSLTLGALQRIEAEGSFRFENPENIVTGDKGTYFADREVFIVTGNVILTQPSGSSVSGERLTYNLKTRAARFGEDSGDGRVTFELK